MKTNIYKNSNGSFYVDKKYKGYRIRKKGFESKKDAEKYLEEEKSYIDRIIKDERGIKLKKISFGTLFDEYLSTQNLADKTIRNKKQIFYDYVYVDWPVIDQKDDRDFISIYNHIIKKATARGISRKQGNAAINLLNKLIVFGKDKGYIRLDVSVHNEMFFKKAARKVSEKTEKNYLLVGQYEMLMKSLEFLKKNPSFFSAKILDVDDFEFFLLMLGHIGLRIGEMRALTFSDLFKELIDDKVVYKIHVNKQFSDESHEIYNWTKTGDERCPVVPDFLVDKINKHKLKHHFDDADYIFNTAYNKKKNDGRSILAKSFRAILKKAIFTLKDNNILPEYFNHDISCNALRRTAEDYLTTVDAIDTKTASEVMGHSEKVAFIHYKKSQLSSEITISNRQEDNIVHQDVIDVNVPNNDNKTKEESMPMTLDGIVKMLQNVVIDHVTGKMCNAEYEKIKTIAQKLFI